MKVIVSKNLNVRVGAPSLEAPCYQYLAPGSELEVDGKTYKGDAYDGINSWYKDEAGNYYWSGGIEFSTLKTALLMDIPSSWWLKNYGVIELWQQGLTGKGISIAVVDSGISYPHEDLLLDPRNFKDFSGSNLSYKDNTGHGTHVTGIIKAVNNEVGSIGVAPDAEIYSCKIRHETYGGRMPYLVKALEWLATQKVDIINISQGFPDDSEELQKAIDVLSEKGCLLIAASGNKTPGAVDDALLYPAKYASVISVGAIDENKVLIPSAKVSAEIDLYAPGNEILSTALNNTYKPMSGSSQAAPYVSAVCALALEKHRKNTPGEKAGQLKDILLSSCEMTSSLKIINPINFINKL